MANVVENLGKLERRVTISLPKDTVQKEVDSRIRQLAKNVRMPGFRPGKVPLKMVTQQYSGQVEAEVLSDKVGKEFFDISRTENLRVAGQPSFAPKVDAAEGDYAFDATFEVYPEVNLGDVSTAEIERTTTTISEAEIDRTLDILRKQRVHFHARGDAGEHGDGGADTAAKDGDRVTVDFAGKIDGEVFQGGSAEDFAFVLGEGRMLPEFEKAALGLKVGEAKEFDLAFPADYHGKDVAGKTAQFTITMKKIEWPHQPEIDAEFAKSLGIEDGDLDVFRKEVRANLERELKAALMARLKTEVAEKLASKHGELDVPKLMVQSEAQNMAAGNVPRGQQPPPQLIEAAMPIAHKRVIAGLLMGEIARKQSLVIDRKRIAEQLAAIASTYEEPEKVIELYNGDPQLMSGLQNRVMEDQVAEWVAEHAKTTQQDLSFDDVMRPANA